MMVAVVGVLLLAVGCERDTVERPSDGGTAPLTTSTSASTPPPRDDGVAAVTVDDAKNAPAMRRLALEHDFGVLRPGARVIHTFAITNDSDSIWTVKNISRHCNCTVAKMSTTRIDPRETVEAILTYHAPSKHTDDRRTVEIYLNEERAPVIGITVSAAIRPPVSLSEQGVRFTGRQRSYRGVGKPPHAKRRTTFFAILPWNHVTRLHATAHR